MSLFALTGVPGAGKSTLIDYIDAKVPDCHTVHEAGLAIYNLMRADGVENPWADLRKTEKEIQEAQVLALKKMPKEKVVLVDRTLVDSEAFANYFVGGVMHEESKVAMYAMRTVYGFNRHVFLLKPNPDPKTFEVKDGRREKDSREAEALEKHFGDCYLRQGYIVHEIAWGPVKERATKIMHLMMKFLSESPSHPQIPLELFHQHADGLNEEGGALGHLLEKGQLFCNLSAVLDRPHLDAKIEYEALGDEKRLRGYTIKEEVIADFNERQVLFVQVMALLHYLKQAHALVKKPSQESVQIIVHLFRRKDGIGSIENLLKVLEIASPELAKERMPSDEDFQIEHSRYRFAEHNVTMIFTYGVAPGAYQHLKRSHHLKTTQIFLTFGVHAGFNPHLPPGALVLPCRWMPFSIQHQELYPEQSYNGYNHLAEELPRMLKSTNQELLAARINQNFHSRNPQKQQLVARPIQERDIPFVTIAESSGIYNPSKLASQKFSIIHMG